MPREQLVDQLIVGLILQVLVTIALTAWGRWVARRRGTAAYVWAARGPWVSFVLLTIGTLLPIRMLTKTFDGLANVDASLKAQALAKGISEAMNLAAMFLIPGYLILLVCVVLFIVGSVRA